MNTQSETLIEFNKEKVVDILQDFLHSAMYDIRKNNGLKDTKEWILMYPNFLVPYIDDVVMKSGWNASFINYDFLRHEHRVVFMGFALRPGYEMKFVLYHPDFLLYKYEWMKHEVSIKLL